MNDCKCSALSSAEHSAKGSDPLALCTNRCAQGFGTASGAQIVSQPASPPPSATFMLQQGEGYKWDCDSKCKCAITTSKLFFLPRVSGRVCGRAHQGASCRTSWAPQDWQLVCLSCEILFCTKFSGPPCRAGG